MKIISPSMEWTISEGNILESSPFMWNPPLGPLPEVSKSFLTRSCNILAVKASGELMAVDITFYPAFSCLLGRVAM